MAEPTVFELSRPGRRGVSLPSLDVPARPIAELLPSGALRRDLPELPELSEVDAVRHFVHLSALNYHVDKGLYPLGILHDET